MSRADRRRTTRAVAPRPGAGANPAAPSSRVAARDWTTTALAALFVVGATAFLVATARGTAAKITWYLAVDQFGYLQFAHDLLLGHVFHRWPPADALANLLPPRTDMLAQTYVWDHGRLYCRYAPGFPILLAAWVALFGDVGAPYLNVALYLLFLALVGALVWRLTGSPWRGLVAAAIVVLVPQHMYYWGLTLTRDVSAHLFAFLGLFLLLPNRRRLAPRRAFLAALPLGFAGSIRNDAVVLYLIPATLVFAVRMRREHGDARRLLGCAGAAAVGLLVGLLPTLVVNALATGNPLVPTQGMEVSQFLPSSAPQPGGPTIGYPSPGWHGTETAQISGGGLKLSNFPRTVVGNWHIVLSTHGEIVLGLAAVGALAAIVLRPMLFLVAVPYAVAAFLFFSCWARPDTAMRYMIGIFAFLPVLAAEGICGPIDVVRWIARRSDAAARGAAVVVALVAFGVALAWSGSTPTPPSDFMLGQLAASELGMLQWSLILALGFGAMAAATWPRMRVAAVLAPSLAIVLTGQVVARGDALAASHAAFQEADMQRARATFRAAVVPGSIVITTEDIGRPAENIEYYSDVARSLYTTDLDRWHVPAWKAAINCIYAGMRPYLLFQAGSSELKQLLAELQAKGYATERVAAIGPGHNMDYFVAAPFHHGLPLDLYVVSHPSIERAMKDHGREPPPVR